MSQRLGTALLALALTLGLAPPSSAQPDAPADVPAGDGVIEGRLLAEDAAATANVDIILYSLSSDGEPGLRRGTADTDGSFRFEGIATDPGIVYLVGSRVEGVPFGARARFEEGQTTLRVDVAVSAPTADAADTAELDPGTAELVFAQGCRDLRVTLVHELRNPTGRVIFVPPDQRAGATPPFEVTLPPGASAIETPLGTTEGYVREGDTLRFWGPVYAGGQRVEIGYGLPLAEGPLEFGFARGTAKVRVFHPPAGPQVTGEGLRTLGERAIPSGLHRVLEADIASEAPRLRVSIAGLGDVAASGARVVQSRLWIEADDALVDVSEQYAVETDGTGSPVSQNGAPLLCLGLPEGARDLRFSREALEMGLSRDPSGALALHGPLPAGESGFALRYTLPVEGERVALTRRFETAIPLLSLLVADTGLVPRGERLHRKRPVRNNDRAYLHLEGFAIERDEELDLVLERLPTRERLPALASIGVVFVLALASLAYLTGPLRTADAAAPEDAEAMSTERAALYSAIDALDEDFDTGKLSSEDHQRMRDELRARAVAVLQAEREAQQDLAAPAQPTQAAAVCPSCGAPTRAGDRFCAKCGAPLDSAEAAGS